jgi:hypothetical protein
MRTFTLTQRIHRTPAEVWDFMVVHQPENHPKWEQEVVSVKREGPLKAGTRGMMLRREGGRVVEAPFEIVECELSRRIVYRSGRGGFHLELTFVLEPVGNETDLSVRSELTLSGAMQLLWPVMWFAFPQRSARISRDCANVMNGEPPSFGVSAAYRPATP